MLRYAETFPPVYSSPKKQRWRHQRWGRGDPDPEPQILSKVELSKLRPISALVGSVPTVDQDQLKFKQDLVLDTFCNSKTGRRDFLMGYVEPQKE